MATGNTLYGISAGVASTGQPAYTVAAIEQVLRKKWSTAWFRAVPLVAVIKEGESNWQKGFSISGNMMLLPVILGAASTAPDGVADANELTPITPYAISNLTQAAYNIAHYRGAMYHRASEQRLINNARANYKEGALQQLMDGFVNAQADDLASTAADSRTAVLGVQQALATANTVGGIDQSTDTDWQAQVLTAAGSFTLDLLDDKMDAVKIRNGQIDLMALSHASGVNLFGKLRNALAPAERIVNANFKAKYGFESIVYRDAMCIQDNRLTSGVICGFDSGTWFYYGDEKPMLDHNQPLTGTDADEFLYNMFCGVATNAPYRNFRLTGVS